MNLMSILGPLPEWMADAVCAQTDPELWFPERGEPAHAARDICATCPVCEQCLAWAMAQEGDLQRAFRHGIWGGTTPAEREAMATGMCERGHAMTADNLTTNRRGEVTCATCERRKRAAAARRRRERKRRRELARIRAEAAREYEAQQKRGVL